MIGNADKVSKVPELQKRILFTLGMLAIYRIGVYVPTPGVDAASLQQIIQAQQGNIVGFFNLFSGGALEQFSILTLNVMPYITASIILQLLTMVFPALDRMNKSGEAGRKKFTQWTRYLTVGLAFVQGFAIATTLEAQTGPGGEPIVLEAGWAFRFMTALTLTSGTIFLMWLGERITERGIGNGISLIIAAGIVARFPSAIGNTVALARSGELATFAVMGLGIMALAVVGIIVYFERSARRIPVQYPRRTVGRRVYAGQTSHLPMRINPSGVIPVIFASSLLMFPITLGSWFGTGTAMSDFIERNFGPGDIIYNGIYVALTIFFCYFYTAVTFNPADVAENLKKGGAYIPGIRPGHTTAAYIDRILMRIVFVGALYLSAVAVLPNILVTQANVPFYFGGTSLLIVVGVALDTMQQIEGHLISRNYDGLMGKGTKIQGRRVRMR